MPLPERPRVVITGAASGLGRALALELARRRARILIADIDLPGAEETAAAVARAGGEASITRCDVSRSEEVAALVGEADRALGGVDLLVNNAGVAVGGPIEEIPLADWEWVVGINLWGVIYGCHAFVPRFKAQRSGAILNVASCAGLLPAPPLAPYNVTKAGVVALSETLKVEVADLGVTVTVLCPMFFKTNIHTSGRAHGEGPGPEAVEKLMERSKIQADGVARIAIEAVDKGRLYALPHPEGRWLWRVKRAVPEAFYNKIVPQLQRMLR
jgi:NAD(P)-dependent dehydrogenase (short-subunit alcohol dehydrogenase family)